MLYVLKNFDEIFEQYFYEELVKNNRKELEVDLTKSTLGKYFWNLFAECMALATLSELNRAKQDEELKNIQFKQGACMKIQGARDVMGGLKFEDIKL